MHFYDFLNINVVFFISSILFTIVILFLLCSIPHTILNIYEMKQVISTYYLEFFDEDHYKRENECFEPPEWAIVLCSISSFCMVFNASIGFLVYCFACSQFLECVKKILPWIVKKWIFRKFKHCIFLRFRFLQIGNIVVFFNQSLEVYLYIKM